MIRDPMAAVEFHVGDCRAVLATLPAASVQCVVTSPPYWQLRDYDCEGQLGLEATMEEYVAEMVGVFRQVWRVLREDGILFLNLGDSYAASHHGAASSNHQSKASPDAFRGARYSGGLSVRPHGVIKPKDLCGIPWRVALALQADGWWLRSDIVWAKPNPMPESVTDRPTRAHEMVFMLTRAARYFYDGEAVRQPLAPDSLRESKYIPRANQKANAAGLHHTNGEMPSHFEKGYSNPAGRNLRSVLTLPTESFPDSHFACVDDQTEALTPSGWKRHTELTDGELIAMYDPARDACRFASASFHRYDYEGDLVAIEKRDMSQRLTPNHRCYIRRRTGGLAVVRADELKPGMEVLTCAPIEVAAGVGIGMTRAALLGWYVTEGNTYRNYTQLYQSENANPDKVAEIRCLLVAAGGHFSERRRVRGPSIEVIFGVMGEPGRFLRERGKDLSTAVLSLPEAEARRLLAAIIDGDGCRRTDRRSCIIQKDRAAIDWMQVLALRLGYRAIVSERPNGVHCLFLTEGRWLTLRDTNGVHTPIGREPYAGIVWCPSVETGFWLARRRGRPFITGNTFPRALVRPLILAGTSQWGCCAACGAPYVREVEKSGGSTGKSWHDHPDDLCQGNAKRFDSAEWATYRRETLGWTPTCSCPPADPVPCVCLDPFAGSGTVGAVAAELGRRAVLLDAKEEYIEMAKERVRRFGRPRRKPPEEVREQLAFAAWEEEP